MSSLSWVDPALDAPESDDKKIVVKQQGDTECENCKRVLPFKHIYYGHCKYCVHECH